MSSSIHLPFFRAILVITVLLVTFVVCVYRFSKYVGVVDPGMDLPLNSPKFVMYGRRVQCKKSMCVCVCVCVCAYASLQIAVHSYVHVSLHTQVQSTQWSDQSWA